MNPEILHIPRTQIQQKYESESKQRVIHKLAQILQ